MVHKTIIHILRNFLFIVVQVDYRGTIGETDMCRLVDPHHIGVVVPRVRVVDG